MADFNIGYKAEFTEKEAALARSKRDELLTALADRMRGGFPADAPETLALVERYRYEFIDQYLYRSNPTILLGLSTVLATDARNRAAYESYAPGLADYLAAALRAYYETLS